MTPARRFVYVLKSEVEPSQYYVGLSADPRARLLQHNAGLCRYTRKPRPWRMHVVVEFEDQEVTARFERYLKSGSGRAFAKRHFAPSASSAACRKRQPWRRSEAM